MFNWIYKTFAKIPTKYYIIMALAHKMNTKKQKTKIQNTVNRNEL